MGNVVGPRASPVSTPPTKQTTTRNEELLEHIDTLKRQVAAKEAEVSQETNNAETLQGSIQLLKRQGEQLDLRLKINTAGQLQKKLIALKREAANCEANATKESSFAERCEQELSEAKKERVSLEQAYQNLKAQSEDPELAALEQRLQDTASKLRETKSDVRKRRSRIQYLEARLLDLLQEENSFQDSKGDSGEVFSRMEASRKKRDQLILEAKVIEEDIDNV